MSHLMGSPSCRLPRHEIARVGEFMAKRVVPLDCTARISLFNASNLFVTHQRVSAAEEARDTSADKVCLHLHRVCTRNVFDRGDSAGFALFRIESNIRMSCYLYPIIDSLESALC